MKKIIALVCCFSLAGVSLAGQPIVTEIPNNYLLTPHTEDTILVQSCDQLVDGVSDGCQPVAIISSEGLRDEIVFGTGQMVLRFVTELMVGCFSFLWVVQERFKMRGSLRFAGLVVGVGLIVGSMWERRDDHLISPGTYNKDGPVVVKDEEDLMALTELINGYGLAVD